MARVTVEDCIDKIPNRYELLMVAAQRAKDIPVIALREIAEETVSIEELQKSLVMGLQKYVEVEEPEEEELEIMAAEKELVDLDEQFNGLLLDNELNDNMQVVDDDDGLDLDADADVTADDDDLQLDDSLDMGVDIDEDFDDIEE